MNKSIVFDMDGVLFDTERLCMESWDIVAEKNGIHGMKEVFPQCIGLNGNDTRTLIMNAFGEDFPYDEFREQTSKWFWDFIDKEGLPVKKGVRKLLAYLQQSGYQIGLASSSRYEAVMSHLKQAKLDDYFSVVVTGDMIEHSKPQPDIYLLACKKLDAEPEDVYAIEDSPNGIRSAYAAGMKPVMVPDLIMPDEEMRQKSCFIGKDLLDVMHYLNN